MRSASIKSIGLNIFGGIGHSCCKCCYSPVHGEMARGFWIYREMTLPFRKIVSIVSSAKCTTLLAEKDFLQAREKLERVRTDCAFKMLCRFRDAISSCAKEEDHKEKDAVLKSVKSWLDSTDVKGFAVDADLEKKELQLVEHRKALRSKLLNGVATVDLSENLQEQCKAWHSFVDVLTTMDLDGDMFGWHLELTGLDDATPPLAPWIGSEWHTRITQFKDQMLKLLEDH